MIMRPNATEVAARVDTKATIARTAAAFVAYRLVFITFLLLVFVLAEIKTADDGERGLAL
jgi:hypothetical protein